MNIVTERANDMKKDEEVSCGEMEMMEIADLNCIFIV